MNTVTKILTLLATLTLCITFAGEVKAAEPQDMVKRDLLETCEIERTEQGKHTQALRAILKVATGSNTFLVKENTRLVNEYNTRGEEYKTAFENLVLFFGASLVVILFALLFVIKAKLRIVRVKVFFLRKGKILPPEAVELLEKAGFIVDKKSE